MHYSPVYPSHGLRHPPASKMDPTPSHKFLGLSNLSDPDKTAVSGSPADDELTEHDVFWTGHSTTTTTTTTTTDHTHSPSTSSHRHVTRPDNFGILAALPEPDHARSVFNHKASSASLSSSSSSSSSRMMIPMIPVSAKKAAQGDRHQSAPVKVPVMTEAMRRRRRGHQFDVLYDDDDKEGDDGETMLLPPHEVVASRQEDRVAYSVLEGVGRTLKGRDLRQVRNAVWRQTGFLD